jgi:uncharacterized membrane protein YfcA
MDFLYVHFTVSGVDTWIFLPPLVAFLVSLSTSMGGISGAFLLLPYQVSFLGFTSPAVSATNFVFNIVAIPSGVYRYMKEGRMAWPLTWVVIVGTLPGVLIGYYVRVLFFPDPSTFKLFIGMVLLYIGGRLLYEMTPRSRKGKRDRRDLEDKFSRHVSDMKKERNVVISSGLPREAVVRTLSFSVTRVAFEFWGQKFSFHTLGTLLLAFVVGIIGGIYGVGGGAIIAPFCVAFFDLPVYTVAGASLMGTFLTSIAGVFFYSVLPEAHGLSTRPDWLLGCLFGIGGIGGMYCGARLQKFFPQKIIKLILGACITFLACRYILQFFV